MCNGAYGIIIVIKSLCGHESHSSIVCVHCPSAISDLGLFVID